VDTGGALVHTGKFPDTGDQLTAHSWKLDFPSSFREYDKNGPSWKKWLDKEKTSEGPWN
jgi:hypothetical protein